VGLFLPAQEQADRRDASAAGPALHPASSADSGNRRTRFPPARSLQRRGGRWRGNASRRAGWVSYRNIQRAHTGRNDGDAATILPRPGTRRTRRRSGERGNQFHRAETSRGPPAEDILRRMPSVWCSCGRSPGENWLSSQAPAPRDFAMTDPVRASIRRDSFR
jgi:hypothetical protein